ncbi:hypothetical protein KR018_008420, partial [Drosophila ironensis]
RKGKLNVVADALSRQPLAEERCGIAQDAVQQEEEPGKDGWIGEILEKIRATPRKYPDYLQEGGSLYRHLPHRAGSEDVAAWRLCVPGQQRERVLRDHDEPTAGHMGVRKTIARISARYFWPGLQRDARKYVAACELCQRYKPSQLQAAGQMR